MWHFRWGLGRVGERKAKEGQGGHPQGLARRNLVLRNLAKPRFPVTTGSELVTPKPTAGELTVGGAAALSRLPWVSGDAGTHIDGQNIKLLLLGVRLLPLELVCIVSGRTHFRKLMAESFESCY